MWRLLLVLALVAAACSASDESTSSTTTPPPATTYRFVVSVGLTDSPGSSDVAPVAMLSGDAATGPPSTMRLLGALPGGSPIDLAFDGVRWHDADDPDLELSADDVELFLGANGFLLPSTISELLLDEGEWTVIDTDELLGEPATVSRRIGIVKGRDWSNGDLAQLDVWRTEAGELVKFVAWFATGDNTGFPVTTWEITERGP